jgi:hypothetical protein
MTIGHFEARAETQLPLAAIAQSDRLDKVENACGVIE